MTRFFPSGIALSLISNAKFSLRDGHIPEARLSCLSALGACETFDEYLTLAKIELQAGDREGGNAQYLKSD